MNKLMFFTLASLLLASLADLHAALIPVTDAKIQSGLSHYNWVCRADGINSSVNGASLTVGFSGTTQVVMLVDVSSMTKMLCDCKGHPGIASYPTKIGTPAPGYVRDPLKLWREETAECGVSLHVHYSGVVDREAVTRHPKWAARKPDGTCWGEATSVFGPYVDQLMIPMLKR